MNFTTPLIAAEFAFASLAYSASVSASITDVTVYNGMGNLVKSAPAIICFAENAKELYKATGVYNMMVHVKTKEIAIDTTPSNVGLISGLMGLTFLTGSVIQNLNNQTSAFGVIDIINHDYSNTQEGDTWVQTLSLEIIGGLTGN